VLPGLIDGHTHIKTIAAAQLALASGATTVRILGVEHYTDVGLRELHRLGMSDIPDIVACGYQLRPDVMEQFFFDFPDLLALKPRLAGAANVQRVIKANLSRRVDCIKVLATERAGTANTDPTKRTFSDQDLVAIVRASGGKHVAAHAHEAAGVAAAVEAGAHTIEHGTYVTDQTLARMKGRGTCFVSTVLAGSVGAPDDPESLVRRRAEMAPIRRDTAQRASRSGVKFVIATDVDYMTPRMIQRRLYEDVIAHTRLGILPLDAIRAVTSTAADCIGIGGRTGAIRRGLEADLIVVDDDPLTDIETLRNAVVVINDGRVVRNTLTAR
jgi:imidazolonepropionase-like amidohydrolase